MKFQTKLLVEHKCPNVFFSVLCVCKSDSNMPGLLFSNQTIVPLNSPRCCQRRLWL